MSRLEIIVGVSYSFFMPHISYFLGIIIYMYYDEHNPPHIHAVYGGYKASYEIKSAKRSTGNMSPTAEVDQNDYV